MTRINNNMIIMNFLENHKRSKNRQSKYLDQLANFKKFDQISDSSLEAIKSLKLGTVITFNDSYTEKAEDGISWLSVTDQALSDVVKTLRKVRDLTVQGANDPLGQEEREKIAGQVAELRKYLIDLGNAKYADNYLFNGTKTKTEPYIEVNSALPADYINGTLSTELLKREVGENITVEISASGQTIGFSQLFADLYNLETDLISNNTAGIGAALTTIDQHVENILGVQAGVGSNHNRLELVIDRLSANKISYTEILAKTEGIDVAETITNLKSEEALYRAALAVGARIMQPTLIDFLN